MRIAVVGDVHRQWTIGDSRSLDAANYDLILFVGDLPGMLHEGMKTTAQAISTLKTRTLLMPGNHDGTSAMGVLAEVVGGRRRPGMAVRAQRRMDQLQDWLGPVELVGYTAHPFPDHDLTVIAGRPHAMDGRHISFAPVLEATHAVSNFGESIERYSSLIEATAGPLLFLAHNGPRGFGRDPRAPWVVAGRDIGDPDLAAAVHRAQQQQRRVVACVAGHIHHQGDRRWWIEQDGTGYLNAARVPGQRSGAGGRERHHVSLEIGPDRVVATEHWWPEA
ncbi:MAG: metallophosphoesterase [Myxococcota bacterium]